MSPKGKANELVNKFHNHFIEWDVAKELAMIAVDEILSVRNEDRVFVVKGITLDYWKEVKEQIKKL